MKAHILAFRNPLRILTFFTWFYYCHMNNFYDGITVILQILLLLCFSNKIVVNFQFNITNISYTRLLFTICERDNHIYRLFLVTRTPSSGKVYFLNNSYTRRLFTDVNRKIVYTFYFQ